MTSAGVEPVTSSMTVIIHRALAGYCVVNTLIALPDVMAQRATTATWWLVLYLPGFAVILAMMAWRSIRGRSIQHWTGAYAVLALTGLPTGLLAFDRAPGSTSWLWITVGQAIVCAFVWRGAVVGIAYAVLSSGLYAVVRVDARFGATPGHIAVADGLNALVVGVTLGLTADGMIRAGRAADGLAARVTRQRTEQALRTAMAEERARLDRMIHDDVMTTLTAAAHATDPTTEEGSRRLARHTLTAIDRLQVGPLTSGVLTLDLLVRLLEETATRVSPTVRVLDRRRSTERSAGLPAREAEALLSAAREAVRNAVHHAHAETITVSVETADRRPDGVILRVTVTDDGSGFAPQSVPADRLGIRASITERLAAVGGSATVTSTPGAGTVIVLALPLPAVARLDPRTTETPVVGMPAEFPTRLLAGLTWLLVLTLMGLGLRYEYAMTWPWLSRLAMLAIIGALLIALRTGRSLRLSGRSAAAVVALTATAAVLVAAALRSDVWPGYGLWLTMPVALIEVISILRGRTAVGVTVWLVWSLCLVAWFRTTPLGVEKLPGFLFLPAAFLVMGLFVHRNLLEISRRRWIFEREEAESLAGEIRRQVASVQRSLWVADLEATVRDVLERIATSTGRIATELQRECLLIEGALRESLVARNLMSERLTRLTEQARRRGVSLTFVDSRSTPAPRAIGRAVLAEVQAALGRDSVSRVVVRLAPDRDASASVVSADATTTSITTIDADGVRRPR